MYFFDFEYVAEMFNFFPKTANFTPAANFTPVDGTYKNKLLIGIQAPVIRLGLPCTFTSGEKPMTS